MNCELHLLPELECEPYCVREVLRCLLRTILFHRALGLVQPRECDSELFELSYVACADAALDKALEDKIGDFAAWADRSPGKKGTLCLGFYERRAKAAWFGAQEDRQFWEQWRLPLRIVATADSPSLGADSRRALERGLIESMAEIHRAAHRSRDLVPPVSSPDVACFPFEISGPSDSGSGFGLDLFKRMLKADPPAMI